MVPLHRKPCEICSWLIAVVQPASESTYTTLVFDGLSSDSCNLDSAGDPTPPLISHRTVYFQRVIPPLISVYSVGCLCNSDWSMWLYVAATLIVATTSQATNDADNQSTWVTSMRSLLLVTSVNGLSHSAHGCWMVSSMRAAMLCVTTHSHWWFPSVNCIPGRCRCSNCLWHGYDDVDCRIQPRPLLLYWLFLFVGVSFRRRQTRGHIRTRRRLVHAFTKSDFCRREINEK